MVGDDGELLIRDPMGHEGLMRDPPDRRRSPAPSPPSATSCAPVDCTIADLQPALPRSTRSFR